MNTKELQESLLSYKDFGGVYSVDTIPDIVCSKIFYIVNLSRHFHAGSHWICIYVKNNKIELFDSIPKPISDYDFCLLKKIDRGFERNTKRVQDFNSVSCGKHCIFFIKMKESGYSFRTIMSEFYTDNLNLNENIVLSYTS